MSKQLIQATGYSWRAGAFREVMVLPDTPDGHPEIEYRAVRITESGLEYYDGEKWVSVSVSAGAYKLFAQIEVKTGGVIEPEEQDYTNTNLTGLFVAVYLNGLLLSTGIAGQQGYSYNILVGEIDFYAPLAAGDVLQIFTYSPSVSAGNITMATSFEDIVQSGSPRFIQCISDTVNGDGETTLYYWTGSSLLFIVVQDLI